MVIQRMTAPTRQLLKALLGYKGEPAYGYDLMKRADLKSGTLYPLLARLEQGGYLVSQWEENPSPQSGRPARRLYVLTEEGRALAEMETAKNEAANLRGAAHA